jgi:hypothetical protein
MPDLATSIAAARASFDALYEGVFATKSPLMKSQALGISNALAVALRQPEGDSYDIPETLTQPTADAFLLTMRNLRVEIDAYNLGHLVPLYDNLFDEVSALFHDFAPGVSLG